MHHHNRRPAPFASSRRNISSRVDGVVCGKINLTIHHQAHSTYAQGVESSKQQKDNWQTAVGRLSVIVVSLISLLPLLRAVEKSDGRSVVRQIRPSSIGGCSSSSWRRSCCLLSSLCCCNSQSGPENLSHPALRVDQDGIHQWHPAAAEPATDEPQLDNLQCNRAR